MGGGKGRWGWEKLRRRVFACWWRWCLEGESQGSPPRRLSRPQIPRLSVQVPHAGLHFQLPTGCPALPRLTYTRGEGSLPYPLHVLQYPSPDTLAPETSHPLNSSNIYAVCVKSHWGYPSILNRLLPHCPPASQSRNLGSSHLDNWPDSFPWWLR